MKEQRDERRPTTADVAAAGAERRAAERELMEPALRDGGERGAPTAVAVGPTHGEREPMFAGNEGTAFRHRWDSVQASFVDEPRHAVEEADTLVAEVMQRLATVFADERSRLEGQWSRGTDVSTEDLRQALRRYRGFFDRLLSV